MRTYLVAGAAALAFAGAAIAQDITTGHLDVIDANDDGAVDAAEFDGFMTKVFTGFDANGDGFVTAAEGGEMITAEQFAAANANGDDGLSEQEFMAAVRGDFAAADRDGDGALN
jgi:hypothetical protein